MKLNDYLTSKTFWLGLATIATSATTFYLKQIDLTTAVSGVIGGLSIIFLKDAIFKSGPNTK